MSISLVNKLKIMSIVKTIEYEATERERHRKVSEYSSAHQHDDNLKKEYAKLEKLLNAK